MSPKEENKDKKSNAALREERVLEFWQKNKIFQQSLEKNSPNGEFIYYDGPVTANSKPVLHTMVPFSFKDVIPRYKTMRGYHVRRKGGWDTHGLPVELQVEKKLGLNSKKGIEEYGVAKFNQQCKESVWEYIEFWKNFTNRMGYWADQDNPYVTYHNEYIESVWNIIKKVNEQNLLYKDYRVVPWCPRCGTALSSHELAQGYEDVKDLSVTAKFKIRSAAEKFSRVLGKNPQTTRKSSGGSTYLLAWTTTPWTLPGNLALAVGSDIDYVKIDMVGEFLILAKSRLSIISEPYEIVAEMKGKDLIGLEYEHLYPFLSDSMHENQKGKLVHAFKVYGADFVTTEDGTGIVHTAVMYGQDDFVLGTKIGLPKHHLVGLDGKFLAGTGFLAGRFVKDEDVAVDIIKDLAHRGLLYKKEKYEHSYPHCWRCHTPLIYYARDSWYIKMSEPKVKKKLISENKEINWEPAHIREGRFGEWLKEIKDWALSRERYWGTPLPVWVCESCKMLHVLGSIADLKAITKKSGNKYFILRHGGTEKNAQGLVSYKNEKDDALTEQGAEQVAKIAGKTLKKKIDLIVASPFARTRETAQLIKETIGLSDKQIIFDSRLAEVNPGIFDSKTWDSYHQYVSNIGAGWFEHKIPKGESLSEVARRTGELLYELENKYKNKNILLVTHGGPAWLLFVNSGLYMPQNKSYQVANTQIFVPDFKRFENAEVRELPFVPLPHNENFELDLHRPYIDEVSLVCSCGGNLIRTPEVMDVWLDSGAMPFAQDHYPFENKKWVDGPGFPADYICEAIDQTRGWFYTLHAVGVLMGRGKAFKNVICLGHLLDVTGKKMSKSVGNVVDPWVVIDKYGVDTLRLWMYSVNQPGESKNFDEKTVQLLQQQVFGLLYNVLAFYELYRDKKLETDKKSKSKNILDVWILARLDELIKISTENLDDYKLLEPTRAVRDFIGDLSTWYLRRSRERIKEGNIEAKQTLYFVLKSLTKIMAPFAPFAAEDIWLKLRNAKDIESVHLVEWPLASARDLRPEVLKNMQITRDICTAGNAERQKYDIPVRQPLRILFSKVAVGEEYQKIIKEELNVKEVEIDDDLENIVALDRDITDELKLEGNYRELVRAIQDIRKKMSLTPSDIISLGIETDDVGRKLVQKFESEMKKIVMASKVSFGKNDGDQIKINDLIFRVKIEK